MSNTDQQKNFFDESIAAVLTVGLIAYAAFCLTFGFIVFQRESSKGFWPPVILQRVGIETSDATSSPLPQESDHPCPRCRAAGRGKGMPCLHYRPVSSISDLDF